MHWASFFHGNKDNMTIFRVFVCVCLCIRYIHDMCDVRAHGAVFAALTRPFTQFSRSNAVGATNVVHLRLIQWAQAASLRLTLIHKHTHHHRSNSHITFLTCAKKFFSWKRVTIRIASLILVFCDFCFESFFFFFTFLSSRANFFLLPLIVCYTFVLDIFYCVQCCFIPVFFGLFICVFCAAPTRFITNQFPFTNIDLDFEDLRTFKE